MTTNRRNFLRGVGGFSLALPLLEGLRPSTAKASDPDVPPFAIFITPAFAFGPTPPLAVRLVLVFLPRDQSALQRPVFGCLRQRVSERNRDPVPRLEPPESALQRAQLHQLADGAVLELVLEPAVRAELAVVDGADLALVLAAWGQPCLGCAADVNGDGEVNGADLALILAGWGI